MKTTFGINSLAVLCLSFCVGCISSADRPLNTLPPAPPIQVQTAPLAQTIKAVLLDERTQMQQFCQTLQSQATANTGTLDDRAKSFNDKAAALGKDAAGKISAGVQSLKSSGATEAEVWRQMSLGYGP